MSTKQTNSKEELEHLLSVLKIEQEEDRLQYKEKVLKSSLSERKRIGVTWYPIVIKESYYSVGERLVLEIERPTSKDVPHQFQSGKVASLFSNYNNEGIDNPSISGVVSSSGFNNLKLTLFVDELPDWVDQGKLGLDLLFDETSYKEMEIALNKVMKARHNRLEQLRETILGYEPAKFSDEESVTINELNESQNRALNNVLRAEDVAIIHGPPGTGKTTTLIHSIAEILKSEKQVLVCAPSNAAVDLLTEKLSEKGISVLRFGNPSRISEELLSHSLDYKITNHKDYKQIKELKKRAIEFRNLALKYKRHFGREERSQRKMILDEARKIQTQAANIEKYITEDLIEKAQVFTTTLVGSNNHHIRNKEFETVFIDEAAQALEPACWIPITKAGRVIFAGDHFQLPPTVKSMEAGKAGLSITLFEKCIQRQEESSLTRVDVMLELQYRMHEHIMNFSNKIFYKGKLKAHDSVRTTVLGSGFEILEKPVEFIDTAGCSFDERSEKESSSTYNPDEADLLFKHLNLLAENLKTSNVDASQLRVGIISPYKAQVNLLKEKLIEQPALSDFFCRVAVNTVDGFQGQERDIIYISLVRSNDNGEIGFLNDIRRMNVAITRAKKKLIVIGDSGTLSQHKFYKDFLDYIDSINAYKSAWEFI
jgi:ATP-dependent RNA/DNA helicase IGHMBP2